MSEASYLVRHIWYKMPFSVQDVNKLAFNFMGRQQRLDQVLCQDNPKNGKPGMRSVYHVVELQVLPLLAKDPEITPAAL